MNNISNNSVYETRYRFKMYGNGNIKEAMILNYSDMEDISDEEFNKNYKWEFTHLIDIENFKKYMCKYEFSHEDEWKDFSFNNQDSVTHVDLVISGEFSHFHKDKEIILKNAKYYYEVFYSNKNSKRTIPYHFEGNCSTTWCWDTLPLVNQIIENDNITVDFN